jgi:hypothetical protein
MQVMAINITIDPVLKATVRARAALLRFVKAA